MASLKTDRSAAATLTFSMLQSKFCCFTSICCCSPVPFIDSFSFFLKKGGRKEKEGKTLYKSGVEQLGREVRVSFLV